MKEVIWQLKKGSIWGGERQRRGQNGRTQCSSTSCLLCAPYRYSKMLHRIAVCLVGCRGHCRNIAIEARSLFVRAPEAVVEEEHLNFWSSLPGQSSGPPRPLPLPNSRLDFILTLSSSSFTSLFFAFIRRFRREVRTVCAVCGSPLSELWWSQAILVGCTAPRRISR